MRFLILISTVLLCVSVNADPIRQTKGEFYDAFRQLDTALPTANVYRTASGAPGPRYWQQRADHKIKVRLDETRRRISASQSVTYTNNSPDPLRYIWLQLDQNRFADGSLDRNSATAADLAGRRNWAERETDDLLTYSTIARHQVDKDVEHGLNIEKVADGRGRDLPYTIVDTMMRVDLPKALEPGERTEFSVAWSFNIINEARIGGRGGYEHFSENDTYI